MTLVLLGLVLAQAICLDSLDDDPESLNRAATLEGKIVSHIGDEAAKRRGEVADDEAVTA
jgi:hypothetical protein